MQKLTSHLHNSNNDIVASKFMTGISNHHKRNTPTSLSDLGLFGAVLQIIAALLIIVGAVLHWIWKR